MPSAWHFAEDATHLHHSIRTQSLEEKTMKRFYIVSGDLHDIPITAASQRNKLRTRASDYINGLCAFICYWLGVCTSGRMVLDVAGTLRSTLNSNNRPYMLDGNEFRSQRKICHLPLLMNNDESNENYRNSAHARPKHLSRFLSWRTGHGEKNKRVRRHRHFRIFPFFFVVNAKFIHVFFLRRNHKHGTEIVHVFKNGHNAVHGGV